MLDTAVLLSGRDPPHGVWMTTSEAAAEVKPGGRDARRFSNWQDLGLRIMDPSGMARQDVEDTARGSGTLERLSHADLSLLALALEQKATLLTDDYTIMDVAKRMDIDYEPVLTEGIKDQKAFKPRCTGCGKWFDAPQPDCPICGSPVKSKPVS